MVRVIRRFGALLLIPCLIGDGAWAQGRSSSQEIESPNFFTEQALSAAEAFAGAQPMLMNNEKAAGFRRVIKTLRPFFILGILQPVAALAYQLREVTTTKTHQWLYEVESWKKPVQMTGQALHYKIETIPIIPGPGHHNALEPIVREMLVQHGVDPSRANILFLERGFQKASAEAAKLGIPHLERLDSSLHLHAGNSLVIPKDVFIFDKGQAVSFVPDDTPAPMITALPTTPSTLTASAHTDSLSWWSAHPAFVHNLLIVAALVSVAVLIILIVRRVQMHRARSVAVSGISTSEDTDIRYIEWMARLHGSSRVPKAVESSPELPVLKQFIIIPFLFLMMGWVHPPAGNQILSRAA